MECAAPAVESQTDRIHLRGSELPLPSDNPVIAVEQRHGWLIPPEWEFISEIWEYERKRVPETVYDHESEVGIIRE